MSASDELIARKGDVQAHASNARRELEAKRAALAEAHGLRRRLLARRIGWLESELEALMAEEVRLRIEIDRAGRDKAR